MADAKLSALTELAATPATGDEVYIRDISEAAADESKRITLANLLAAYNALTSTLTNKTLDANGTGNSITNIENADIAAAAAVAFSKLAALTDGNILVGNGSNVVVSVNPSGDVDISNAGVFSIAADVIIDADVAAAAAIAFSKLAVLTDGNILVGNGSNVVTSVNPSGDVDVSNAGVFSIVADVIVDADVKSDAAISGSKLQAAGLTNSGAVELATAAETTTGTDAGRALTPDGLAGSDVMGGRGIQVRVFDVTTDVATGDRKATFRVDQRLAGMNIVDVHAEVDTAGTTNTLDIQLRNVTQSADILSTKLTVDSAETGSDTAATPAVIDADQDDLQLNDVIAIDIDAIHATAPKGLTVTIGARLP